MGNQRTFLVTDKTGRGYTATLKYPELVKQYKDEKNWEYRNLTPWAKEANPGDVFENATLRILYIGKH